MILIESPKCAQKIEVAKQTVKIAKTKPVPSETEKRFPLRFLYPDQKEARSFLETTYHKHCMF